MYTQKKPAIFIFNHKMAMKYRLNHWKDFPLLSLFIFGRALSHGPFIRLSNWYWIHIWGPFTIIGTTTHIASTNIGRKESYLVAHLFWNLDSARFICYIGGVRGCKAIPSWIQVDRISRLGDLKSTPNIWGSVGHVTGGVESYWKKRGEKEIGYKFWPNIRLQTKCFVGEIAALPIPPLKADLMQSYLNTPFYCIKPVSSSEAFHVLKALA